MVVFVSAAADDDDDDDNDDEDDDVVVDKGRQWRWTTYRFFCGDDGEKQQLCRETTLRVEWKSRR